MIVAIVILLITAFVLYCCVKVGKQADERMEELFPTE